MFLALVRRLQPAGSSLSRLEAFSVCLLAGKLCVVHRRCCRRRVTLNLRCRRPSMTGRARSELEMPLLGREEAQRQDVRRAILGGEDLEGDWESLNELWTSLAALES